MFSFFSISFLKIEKILKIHKLMLHRLCFDELGGLKMITAIQPDPQEQVDELYRNQSRCNSCTIPRNK